MSLPGEPSTVPVYDRNTGEKLLDAGPEHLAQIAALVDDGVEEGQMLMLAIFADHLHAGGSVATFVLNGVAYGPYVENALDAVLDSHLDTQAALEHLLAEMEEPGINPLMVKEPESSTPGLHPAQARIELRQVYKGRGAEDEWQVRNDVEVFEKHKTLEEAEEALKNYPFELAPRPEWMEPPEEVELPELPDPDLSELPGRPEDPGKPENPGKPT